MNSWRRIWAIARYELRIQIRGLAFWAVMILLGGFQGTVLATSSTIPLRALRTNVYEEFSAIPVLSGILLVFLIGDVFHREKRLQFSDVLWARSLGVMEYVLGKCLGVIATAIMAITPAFFLSCAIIAYHSATPFIAKPFLIFALLLMPTVLFVATLYLLLGAILPHRLLAYATGIALWFAMILFQGNLLDLGNVALSGVYHSEIIGFGPDAALLYDNRLFYLATTPTLLVLTAAIYPLLEERSYERPRLRRLTRAFLLISLVALCLAGLNFRQISAQAFRGPETPTAGQSLQGTYPVEIVGYDLSIKINLNANRMMGWAEMTFFNNSIFTPTVQSIPLQLNPGLEIISATSDTRESLEVREGELILPAPLEKGEAQKVIVSYGGRPKVPRTDYASKASPVKAYVGQGMAFLLGDGDWYPAAELGTPQRLTVTMPIGLTAITSATREKKLADAVRYIWDGSRPLPKALLAASNSYVQLSVGDSGIYVPLSHVPLREVITPYIRAIKLLDRWLLGEEHEVMAVEVPLINEITHELRGRRRVIFVPEVVFRTYAYTPENLRRFRNLPADLRPGSHEYYVRQAAEEVARAWWAERIALYGEWQGPETDYLPDTIVAYTAMLIADEIAEGFAAKEIAVRRETEGKPMLSPYDFPTGLAVSSQSFLLLNDLQEGVGDELFHQILRDYLNEYGRTSQLLTMGNFQRIASQTAGRDLSKVFSIYEDSSR